jgi:hypothetical protein
MLTKFDQANLMHYKQKSVIFLTILLFGVFLHSQQAYLIKLWLPVWDYILNNFISSLFALLAFLYVAAMLEEEYSPIHWSLLPYQFKTKMREFCKNSMLEIKRISRKVLSWKIFLTKHGVKTIIFTFFRNNLNKINMLRFTLKKTISNYLETKHKNIAKK